MQVEQHEESGRPALRQLINSIGPSTTPLRTQRDICSGQTGQSSYASLYPLSSARRPCSHAVAFQGSLLSHAASRGPHLGMREDDAPASAARDRCG